MQQQPADRHPLMPGVRSVEINNPHWPRTLHDGQLTGFSPLVLGMSDAPDVWHSIKVAGEYQWIESVAGHNEPCFLLQDGHLSLYSAGSGRLLWRAPVSGQLVFWGDLFGDGAPTALLRQANRLVVVDGRTGDVRWSNQYDPPHVDLRVQVDNILPQSPGQQAAVFEQYGEHGWLLSFEPDGAVREVWRRQVISNDVWPVRADHGCDIAFDLSASRPILWNVRHHRCQSFDAASGEPMGCLQYELEGAFRRNYGPWRIGTGSNGQRTIVVASEMVQTHVHGLHLHVDGTPELAWERYYGEVYVVPGVAVEFLGVHDVDGDGADELVYNVRDPENNFRSFVRARDLTTGQVRHEFADQWCSALVAGTSPSRPAVLVVHPAPSGATPAQGPAQLVELRAAGQRLVHQSFDHAGPWGVTALPTDRGADMLLRVIEHDRPALVRIDGVTLAETERVSDSALLRAPLGAVAHLGHEVRIATATGVYGWPTHEHEPATASGLFELAGGAPPTLSASPFGADGNTMLFAHVSGRRIQAWRFDSTEPVSCLDQPFVGTSSRHSPLLYDLDGDGILELVIPGATAHGELSVRALRPDGSSLWHIVLPGARSDDGGQVVAWNAGRFLATTDGARAGLAISVYSLRRTLEGTFLLDGANGEVCWFRDHYHDGDVIRGYTPQGLPGVFDWDEDGVEEIAWDMYSYMAFLRGDGHMAAIFGGPNVRPEADAVAAISLYNGFSPVYRGDDDTRPRWFVHHGHGRFGLAGPDPRSGIWHEDEGYDTPDRIGFVDVDGDGVLEVGYALRNSTTFRCRDLWTGRDRWSLELPEAPAGPVITADVDGDGKGEFLLHRWCIGTNSDGEGEIRWTSPEPFGWAIVADVDGDGLGEIICATSGCITVLKAQQARDRTAP